MWPGAYRFVTRTGAWHVTRAPRVMGYTAAAHHRVQEHVEDSAHSPHPNEHRHVPSWVCAVAVLACGWVVIWVARMMFTPVYPELSAFFGGATSAELGAISSWYFLGYALMQIPSGLLVDRIGMRRVVIPGFVLFALGTAVMAGAHSLSMLYLGNVLAGVGSGTFYGIAYTITNTRIPARRKSLATAIVNSGTAVGSGLGIASASSLVSTGLISWQMLAGITGALALAMVAVFAKSLPKEHGAGAKTSDTPVGKTFTVHLAAACVLYFATLYLYYLISTWLPDFLHVERAFDASFAGAASIAVFLAGIPGALVAGRIADRHPKRQIALIVALEAAAALALLPLVFGQSAPIVAIGAVAYGFFGKLAVEPLIISWLGARTNPARMTTTFGIFNFFGMSASVFAPLVTGILADATGSDIPGFLTALAILALGVIAFLAILAAHGRRAGSHRTQARDSR